jgi:uncharacterized protein
MAEKSVLVSYLERQISTSPERLFANILDPEKARYNDRFIYIRLEKFIQDYLEGKNIENRWITIPGFRGTGKTTLFSQLYHMLLEKKIPQDRLLYLPLDEITKLLQSDLYEIMGIYETIRGESIEITKDKLFLFIDEAQYDCKWDVTVKTIFDRSKNIFIMVTGSSALALQSSADSARRMHVEKLFPLTFIEYEMLKKKVFPEKNLRGYLERILFSSASADVVYEGLKNYGKNVTSYWSKIEPYEFEKYLSIGTLPFALGLSKDYEIYQRIINILEKVIYDDIATLDSYDKSTLDKIWNLLTILSDTDKISLETLGSKINVEKPTVFKILTTLSKAELIIPVKAYGSVTKQTTKSPKYPFAAPMIKAALLWKLGKMTPTPDIYGKLLQDVVALYLYKMTNIQPNYSLNYDSDKEGADFIIGNTKDNSQIAIEVSYGSHKDTQQARITMEKLNGKYGLVVSSKELSIQDKVVFVPQRYFFLL